MTDLLDQGNSHHQRQGPNLAYGKRGALLIGLNKLMQRLFTEDAVGMGDDLQGDGKYSRNALEISVAKHRQVLKSVFPNAEQDFLDLFFDNIVIIQQPFPSRGYLPLFAQILCRTQVHPGDKLKIILQPADN